MSLASCESKPAQSAKPAFGFVCTPRAIPGETPAESGTTRTGRRKPSFTNNLRPHVLSGSGAFSRSKPPASPCSVLLRMERFRAATSPAIGRSGSGPPEVAVPRGGSRHGPCDAARPARAACLAWHLEPESAPAHAGWPRAGGARLAWDRYPGLRRSAKPGIRAHRAGCPRPRGKPGRRDPSGDDDPSEPPANASPASRPGSR